MNSGSQALTNNDQPESGQDGAQHQGQIARPHPQGGAQLVPRGRDREGNPDHHEDPAGKQAIAMRARGRRTIHTRASLSRQRSHRTP